MLLNWSISQLFQHRIQFDDTATRTFEYPSEASMLEGESSVDGETSGSVEQSTPISNKTSSTNSATSMSTLLGNFNFPLKQGKYIFLFPFFLLFIFLFRFEIYNYILSKAITKVVSLFSCFFFFYRNEHHEHWIFYKQLWKIWIPLKYLIWKNPMKNFLI